MYSIIYTRASSKRLNFELNMCNTTACSFYYSYDYKHLSFVIIITVLYNYGIVKSSCISLISGRPYSLAGHDDHLLQRHSHCIIL